MQKENPQIFNVLVKESTDIVERTFMVSSKLKTDVAIGFERDSPNDCIELLDMTVDYISQSLSKFNSSAMGDVKKVLSVVLTNQDTKSCTHYT